MSLPSRVVGLLTRPNEEWAVIAGERSDAESIYRGHIALLAAIPAVATLAGLAISGGRYLGATGIVTAVTAAIVGYAVTMALPLVTAVVIAALASRFKSDAGINETLKVVAYAMTPFWLSGICYLFVALSPLVFVGLAYGLYLFFLGTTPVMGTPVEQRVPLTLIAAIVLLVSSIAINWIVGLLRLPHYGF